MPEKTGEIYCQMPEVALKASLLNTYSDYQLRIIYLMSSCIGKKNRNSHFYCKTYSNPTLLL